MKQIWERWGHLGIPRGLMAALDALLVLLAVAAAWWTRYVVEVGGQVEVSNARTFGDYLPTALVLIGLMLFNLRLVGHYREARGRSGFSEFYGIITATTTSIITIVFFYYFYRPWTYSRLIFAYTAGYIILFLSVARLIERGVQQLLRRRGIGVSRVLLVGAGEPGRTLLRHIVAQPDLGYRIVGFVDDDPDNQKAIGPYALLGKTEEVPILLRTHDVDLVLITLPWQHQKQVMEIIELCTERAIPVRILPDLFQLSLTRVSLDEVRGIPLIAMREPALRGSAFAIKRTMDIIFTLFLLVVATPIMLVVALAIKLDSPGPIFYAQKRVGRFGRPFTFYKFRSMRVGAEAERHLLHEQNEADGPLFKMRDDPRRTRVGAFIRKFSIDELAQLWNVLKGDMSLIGPRPALPDEVEKYQEWHHKRLEAPPGVTGLWQVSGRSNLSFDEMVLLDIYYAEQWSPRLDLQILLRTVPTVLFQRGAY